MKREISLVVVIATALSFIVWLVFYLCHMPLAKDETSCVVLISLVGVTVLKIIWKAFRKRNNSNEPNKPQNRNLLLLLLLIAVISGCKREASSEAPERSPASYPVDSAPAPEPPSESQATTTAPNFPRETTRNFLTGAEEPGFGLYSYLLFGSHPASAAEREKYLEAIRIYLTTIDTVEAVVKYTPKASINITYLPLTEEPPPDPSAEWVLDHYDFARAFWLLGKVKTGLNNGPYIISVAQPLTTSESPIGHHLFFDLSYAPTNVVPYCVKGFMNQATEEDFWEPDKADRWLLRLRTSIAIAATAVPDISGSLKEWIKWND